MLGEERLKKVLAMQISLFKKAKGVKEFVRLDFL